MRFPWGRRAAGAVAERAAELSRAGELVAV